MSSEDGDSRVAMAGGVDYKTLFLGCCTVVVLTSGAAFRIWDSANQRESHSSSESIQSLERRLASLEASAIEYRFQISQLQQENKDLKHGHEAQDRSIYSLERSLLQMERGKR